MRYITGQYALNIHHREDINEPTGDWHGLIGNNITELYLEGNLNVNINYSCFCNLFESC